MLDSIKRVILSALKTVSLTEDDIRSTVGSFVKQGVLTEEQGKKIQDALLERGREAEEARGKLGKEVGRLADLIPVVTRAEFRELAERVRSLEERLGPAPVAPEEVPPAGGAEGAG